jgi:FSR family fosmidomycin resistance protein-like MFS transporter
VPPDQGQDAGVVTDNLSAPKELVSPIASAFLAILVYAQELVPGRVGLISGLFFGFAFGMGGIGAAVLGALADKTSIVFVYHVCAYLPAIGLLTGLLPDLGGKTRKRLRSTDTK